MTDLNSALEAEQQRLAEEETELQDQLRQGAERLTIVRERMGHVMALLGEDWERQDSYSSRHNGDDTMQAVGDTTTEISG